MTSWGKYVMGSAAKDLLRLASSPFCLPVEGILCFRDNENELSEEAQTIDQPKEPHMLPAITGEISAQNHHYATIPPINPINHSLPPLLIQKKFNNYLYNPYLCTPTRRYRIAETISENFFSRHFRTWQLS